MLKNFAYLLLVSALLIDKAYCRFQNIDDVDFTYDFYNVDLTVNEDGTHEKIVEFQITLLKENARNIAGKFPINYNSSSSSLNILEAKTIFNETNYPVTKDMIEDKSVGINMIGFDDQKQTSISFPRTEIGSKIYLKYKETTNSPAIDEEFFENYFYGANGGYWKASTFNISSAIDLQIKINDPYKVLSVSTDAVDGKSNYFRKAQIKLINPITTETINEPSYSSLHPRLLTYFSVSSMNTWEEFGNYLAPKYNEIQNQPMPKLFLEIYEEASNKKDILSQINFVTSNLNQKIQYFGDWQTRKGKFIPQNLAAVASKQSGDCKDFATITVKILKELGYQANVALVSRSVGIREIENVLPNSNSFNHVIVKVIDKKNNVYWIDPTNVVSMADGIFPDIAGKHALVLAEKNSSYEKIPNISETHAKLSSTKFVNPSKIVNFKLELQGEEALQLTGAGLHLSKKSIEDIIYSNCVSSDLEENRISSEIPSLTSRIAEPITISLEYKSPNLFFKTNLGNAYLIDASWYLVDSLARIDASTTMHDYYLGYPRTISRKTVLAKTKISNLDNLNFNIKTSFVSLERKCYIEGEDTMIIEKAIIHRTWVNNNELKSSEFKNLQKTINDEIIGSAVILK